MCGDSVSLSAAHNLVGCSWSAVSKWFRCSRCGPWSKKSAMFLFNTSGDERGWSLDKVSSSICCTCSLTSEIGYSCAVKSSDSCSGSTMSLFEYAAPIGTQPRKRGPGGKVQRQILWRSFNRTLRAARFRRQQAENNLTGNKTVSLMQKRRRIPRKEQPRRARPRCTPSSAFHLRFSVDVDADFHSEWSVQHVR